jgi:hypothetical protein
MKLDAPDDLEHVKVMKTATLGYLGMQKAKAKETKTENEGKWGWTIFVTHGKVPHGRVLVSPSGSTFSLPSGG